LIHFEDLHERERGHERNSVAVLALIVVVLAWTVRAMQYLALVIIDAHDRAMAATGDVLHIGQVAPELD
jgi:hypothetical protein